MICDQLTWRALPAYGDAYAQTPNIDRILRRGLRFGRAYTPCPLCQPARAAFWTGRWPHETGVLSNGRKHPVPPVPETMPTLGALFAEAGYETVHFGKTHDAGSLRGFRIEPKGELPVETEPAWPVNYDTREDRWATEQVVAYLRGSARRPFLAVADLNNPHNICGWVGQNQGPHEDVPIAGPLPELPGNFRDADFSRRPAPVQYICCSHNRLAQAARWNQINFRHYLAAYYHYLALADAEVGRILDALEARPDADQTLIVFFSDHGDGMASHGMTTKQVSFYEETTRVPLVFAGPAVAGSGRQVDVPLVSLQDMVPTLCDCAGIPTPQGLWGRSLRPWLAGTDGGSPHEYVACEWHTEWGFTIEPGRMIRTDRYKYVRYLEGEGEDLYDLHEDPGETRTLIDSPAYQAALQEHRRLLAEHVRRTGDSFFRLQWQADPRWRSHPPGYHHHIGPAAPQYEDPKPEPK